MKHKMAWQSTLEYIRETDTFLVNTNNKSMTNYHDMKNHFFLIIQFVSICITCAGK